MSKMSRAGSGSANTVPCSNPGTTKPVPMKLFATWEVDRTPSNCIPRLCSLTLTRLVVLRPLGTDITSISIAVKMQSSKRTLRSNEIMLPPNGLLDTGLDLTFSLQYPHFLKRDGNRLQILLQRRKRYKNRTMLGFKTLAEGFIRMDQVLQKPMDLELELVADSGSKEKSTGLQTVAKVSVLQLSSTPVDQDQKTTTSIIADRGFSDDEEEAEFTSGEEEGQDMSDSEPIRNKLPHTRHNFKQRFVSLLRRFRAADTEASRAALGATSDIQALFNELDSLSCDEDSGGEQEDTMSISSTPKPSLRPFFSSSRSLLDSQVASEIANTQTTEDKNQSGSDGNPDVCWTDHEAHSDPQTGSPPREKEKESDRKSRLFRGSQVSSAKKKHSISSTLDKSSDITNSAADNTAPRKTFLTTLARVLPQDEVVLPEYVALVDPNVPTNLIQRFEQTPALSNIRLVQPAAPSEVRSTLQTLINKIHKFTSTSAKTPSTIRVIIVGSDTITSACLRNFVELFSGRSPEWQNYLHFYIIPVGNNSIARHIAMLDQGYASLFPVEGPSGSGERSTEDLVSRIQRYILISYPNITQLPLAEAMLTCHDESSQLFIPFVAEVRVGSTDNMMSISVEMEDNVTTTTTSTQGSSGTGTSTSGLLSSSPPGPPLTPPSSPNVQVRDLVWEPLELQLDFWQVIKSTDSNKNRHENKNSLKGSFRSIYVCRMPSSTNLNLTVNFASKEKKQKIMRLGKKKEKDKENEAKNQTIDNISRLICSAKASHSAPLRVSIDGSEWTGVKFFQLSSTWQTHVKYFSVALVGSMSWSSQMPTAADMA